ncbi:MAG: (Fe-S)-binding protein [Candidatus Altiarchaeota archaeon]
MKNDYLDGNVVADLYKLLPGRDCGKKGVKSPCGHALCAEFAAALLKGKSNVFECPYLDDDKSQAIVLVIEDFFQ